MAASMRKITYLDSCKVFHHISILFICIAVLCNILEGRTDGVYDNRLILDDNEDVFRTFQVDSVFLNGEDFDLGTDVLHQQNYTRCKELLKVFSNDASQYINCALSFAKPVRFCERCVEEYIRLNVTYYTIEQDKSCSTLLLRSDNLQILQATKKFATQMWTGGYCENCFSQDASDGQVPYLSHNTLQFWILYNKTQECFMKYNASYISPDSKISEENSSVCKHCRGIYKELGSFFTRNLTKDNTHQCMDLVEMMNITRHEWSKDLQCASHERDTSLVVGIAGVFCVLPILFYITAKIVVEKKERKLLKRQNERQRLHEHLDH